MPSEVDQVVETKAPSRRLISLDALRGFDMFWIMGGQNIVQAAATLTGWAWLVSFADQFHHPEWNGFTLFDLIFPLFLFMVGVSMPFSFERRLERGDSRAQLYRHVVVRALLLFLLGMIYYGLLEFDWPNTRIPSVLGRIGLAYMFAAFIVLNTSVRRQILWIVGILIGYWALLRFVPVPGFGAHDLTPGHTLTDWIDRSLIPGRLYEGDRDPEGILATLPAVGTALFGVLTGKWLKNERFSGYAKVSAMVGVGLVCVLLACLWNQEFPINKNLWTSSFVLLCAGLSLLLLAVFYLVIDVWKLQGWAFPFVVIGSNSIMAYMMGRFIDFEFTAHFFFEGAFRNTRAFQPLLWAMAIVALKWLLLYLFYKKKIFLRV